MVQYMQDLHNHIVFTSAGSSVKVLVQGVGFSVVFDLLLNLSLSNLFVFSCWGSIGI